MPQGLKELVGVRFSRLTVIDEGEPRTQPSGQTKRRMNCKCDCGTSVTVLLGNLRSGHTSSCGCFQREQVASQRMVHGHAKKGGVTWAHRLWSSIKSRTVSGAANKSDRYFGRGISMYAPWINDFQAFYSWVIENLKERPNGCSLNRINNNGNYEPGNLEWATQPEQCNNKANNVRVEFAGELLTISQWAKRTGLKYGTVRSRLKDLNWPVEKALTTPVRRP